MKKKVKQSVPVTFIYLFFQIPICAHTHLPCVSISINTVHIDINKDRGILLSIFEDRLQSCCYKMDRDDVGQMDFELKELFINLDIIVRIP